MVACSVSDTLLRVGAKYLTIKGAADGMLEISPEHTAFTPNKNTPQKLDPAFNLFFGALQRANRCVAVHVADATFQSLRTCWSRKRSTICHGPTALCRPLPPCLCNYSNSWCSARHPHPTQQPHTTSSLRRASECCV